MFESLSSKFSDALGGLSKKGILTEEDVAQAMREVRIAMLDADVALPVVKDFVANVKKNAIGSEVLETVSPGQAVGNIVNQALIDALGGEEVAHLNLDVPQRPAVILMVGLQGSGKTTSSAKLAYRLSHRDKKKVLLASLDIYRPAAQLQLETLGQQASVDVLPIVKDQNVKTITDRALKTGVEGGYDIVILDTAGRLSIDTSLMKEIHDVRDQSTPAETLLVVDAMTGQDAVQTAKAFNEAVGVSGVVLTRMDGDARGGAALSMKAVTGAPVKFIGTGEKLEALDIFFPTRVAGRILGLGDVAGLVEKAADNLDKEESERLAKRMLAGKFDLNDYAAQIRQIEKLGSFSGIMNMLPGLGKIKDAMKGKDLDSSILVKQLAMIGSMTKKERKKPALIKASRKKRIARGSGTSVQDVNKLLKQFSTMSTVMKRLKKFGLKGLAQRGLSALMPEMNKHTMH